jgi:hypothetical protein
LKDRRIGVQFLVDVETFLHSVQTGSATHPVSYLECWGSFFTGKSAGGLKLATHIYLVPRVENGGAILPLPHMSSWRGAYLIKRRDKFNFTYINVISLAI